MEAISVVNVFAQRLRSTVRCVQRRGERREEIGESEIPFRCPRISIVEL